MGQRRSPIGVEDLERVAARGWRALDEDQLGEWLLRAGGGFTGRANSALVVGDAPARALYRRTGFIEHHRYHHHRGRVG